MVMNIVNSQVGTYVAMILLMVVLAASTKLLHSGIKRVEDWVATKVEPEEALKVNDFLDALDKLAETAVQDANSRMVIGLKAAGTFTPEVAKSVNQAVMNDIMANLGPLLDKGKVLVGPLEKIVAQMIEKHVLANKSLVNSLVDQLKTQTPGLMPGV